MAAPGDNTGAKAAARPVSQLVTASDLQGKLEALERSRTRIERQWKLNLAFYRGDQYAYYPRGSWRLSHLPTEEGDKPRYRVRLVSNQIIVGAHHLLAQLTKTKPTMYATPNSGSDEDVKSSQLAERLLEYWWSDFALEDRLEEAILWAIICGQGYWRISWDRVAGKSMKFLMDPTGQPITNEALQDAFRGQLEQYGIPPVENVVYLGDIDVETLSPFNVFLDPTAKTFSEAKWAICKSFLDPDEIFTRWEVSVQPDSMANDPTSSPGVETASQRQERTVRQVNVGYFLPTAALPQGRYVVWMKGDGTEQGSILEDGPWPYDFQELPLVKFGGLREPGKIYDMGVVEQSLPVQKELNRTLSQIMEYKNIMVKPRVWAPVNSVRGRLTNEPGVLMEFNPVQGLRPEPEIIPPLPQYVFETLRDIQGRLNDIFGRTDMQKGELPPNVEAAVAIDLLQETSTDRWVPMIKSNELALEKAGRLMLLFAQRYYQEPRILKIKGSGGGYQVKRFQQADIQNVDLSVEAGSGVPRTRAGKMLRIQQYMNMGVIDPTDAWRYIESADIKSVGSKWAVDEDLAYREHEKLLKGIPLNPEAVMEAMQYVQMGFNPETMEPIQDEAEVQFILERASLKPGVADIHPVHADVHGRYLKSVEFEGLPFDIRRRFVIHFQLTLQAMEGIPQPEPQAPRINLQLKSTVGPSSQAKILRRAGVDVSPEESAEPPLETWVSDSVDKPDTDAAGPGQEAESLSKVAKTLVEAQVAKDRAAGQEASRQRDESRKDAESRERVRQSRSRPRPVSGNK